MRSVKLGAKLMLQADAPETVQLSFCYMSHYLESTFLGLQEISVLLQSARLLSTPTQVKDKILVTYADTAYMSLITMHEHVGHSSCGMYAYMVTG